jgi:predicted transposase YbfD/YdcC
MLAEVEIEILNLFYPTLKVLPGVDTLARAMKLLAVDDAKSWIEHFVLSNLDYVCQGEAHSKDGEFEEYRRKILEELAMVAVDGKEILGATAGSPDEHIIIVNAVGDGQTIAQETVGEKQKKYECFVVPTIIENVVKSYEGDPRPIVFSFDAMSCKRPVATAVHNAGAHYLLSVKDNQKTLHRDCQSIFSEGPSLYPNEIEVFRYETGLLYGHGRIDSYVAEAIDVTSSIAKKWITRVEDWDGLRTVLRIIRRSEDVKTGKISKTYRYYITSLDPDPKKLLAIRLNHWSVETSHFHLDCGYHEDKCKIKDTRAAEILSTFRKLSLNVLKFVQSKVHDSIAFIIKQLLASSKFFSRVLTILDEIFEGA